MTKRELTKLKKAMPPKYRDIIAAEFRITTAYVDMIFRGLHPRKDITDYAIELALDHKQKLLDQSEKIKSL